MSAVAANGIVPLAHFVNWLAFGERGLSSEAIASFLTGSPVGRSHSGRRRAHYDYPHDPSDYRRCQLLLDAVPLAKLAFPSMRDASEAWSRLVAAWDEIDASLEAEAPDYRGTSSWSAPITYRLIRRVIAGGEPCVACGSTGRAAACDRCKGTGRRSGGRCRAVGCWQGYGLCGSCRGNGYVGGVS